MKFERIVDLSEFCDIYTIEHAKHDLMTKFVIRRKERHISQKELAKLTGVSYGSIKRFEQTGEISLSALLNLADKLECLEDFKSLFNEEYVEM